MGSEVTFSTTGSRGVADVFVEIGELVGASFGLPITFDEEMDGQPGEFEATIGVAHALCKAEYRIRRDEDGGGVRGSSAAWGNIENGEGIERIVLLVVEEAADKEAGLEPLAVSELRGGGVIVAGDNVGARSDGEIVAGGNIGLREIGARGLLE